MAASDVHIARSKSIVDYLTYQGVKFRKVGNKMLCSSPFSNDSSWSFYVYPDNTFFDFSTGKGGDVIRLVSSLEGLKKHETIYKLVNGRTSYLKLASTIKVEQEKKQFKLEKFLVEDEDEKKLIDKYANSRGITTGYTHTFHFAGGEKNLAMGFLHRDENLDITGVKMRNIEETNGRFSARGSLNFYILENIIEDSYQDLVLFLVESESSANSLYMYCKQIGYNSVVVSTGGVSKVPSKVPDKYSNCTLKIIIDYDGNEQLYNERINLYTHLNGVDVKLKLNKGEDINYLYNNNKLNLYEQLIF